MSQKEYAYVVPPEHKHHLSTVRAAFRGKAVGEGAIRRYLVTCEFDPERAVSELRAHVKAPLELCPCVVCAGGERRSFKMSGECMSITPFEWQRYEHDQTVFVGSKSMVTGERRKNHLSEGV